MVLPCNETLPIASPETQFIPYFLQWVRTDLSTPFYVAFVSNTPFISEQYNGRVKIVNGLSLQIENVQLEDDGWYECQIVILGDSSPDNGTYTRLTVIGK